MVAPVMAVATQIHAADLTLPRSINPNIAAVTMPVDVSCVVVLYESPFVAGAFASILRTKISSSLLGERESEVGLKTDFHGENEVGRVRTCGKVRDRLIVR